MLKVVEFKSKKAYETWLRTMGTSVRIVNVSTTKRWSVVSGFIGDNKTYTVTYESSDQAENIDRSARSSQAKLLIFLLIVLFVLLIRPHGCQ